MSHRDVTDLLDVVWRVWFVVPPPSQRRRLPAALQQGWLAFQSATERRRIGPAPDDWESLSEDALLTLLADSEPFAAKGDSKPTSTD